MAIRDLSPAQFVAPGMTKVGLEIDMKASGPGLKMLDTWLSNYSPSIDCYVTTAVATFETIESLVPGLDTNARFILIVLPRGNATACTLKGVTGDTGIPVHANGFAFVAITPSAATWGITTAAAITGVRIMIF